MKQTISSLKSDNFLTLFQSWRLKKIYANSGDPRCMGSNRADRQIFFWPPTLTSCIFVASLPKTMLGTSFERSISYLFGDQSSKIFFMPFKICNLVFKYVPIKLLPILEITGYQVPNCKYTSLALVALMFDQEFEDPASSTEKTPTRHNSKPAKNLCDLIQFSTVTISLTLKVAGSAGLCSPFA